MRASFAPVWASISGMTFARVWPSPGSSPRAGSRVAWQRLDVSDELVALRAMERGGDRDFHAELVGSMRLALADAFDLGRMQRIDLPPAPMLALLAHPARQHERMGEDALQVDLAPDLAA